MEVEQYWINSIPPESIYNIIKDVRAFPTFSEEVRKNLREKRKLIKMTVSPQCRLASIIARTGKPMKMRGKKGKEPWNKGKKGEYKIKQADRYFKVIDPNGVIYEGNNIAKFCREHDLHRRAFTRMVRGQRSHYMLWRLFIEIKSEV